MKKTCFGFSNYVCCICDILVAENMKQKQRRACLALGSVLPHFINVNPVEAKELLHRLHSWLQIHSETGKLARCMIVYTIIYFYKLFDKCVEFNV